MKMIEKNIKEMLQAYPGLIHVDNKKNDIFDGTLFINHIEEKSNVSLVGDFGIRIIVGEHYPEELPVVYDISDSIDKDYVHRYRDGELCLETNTRLKLFCMTHSVKEFVDLFLINYLCSYLYYKRYLVYPNGERPHGFVGEYDFLKEYFNVPFEKVPFILKYMLDTGVNRNDLCPCGSKKTIKRCHGKKMIELQNSIKKSGIEKLLLDLAEFFKEVKH